MKAFLSHSSIDKEFIQEVAEQLGRANCIFDKYSFEMGVDFKDSIIKHLGNTSVFVFFASRNSIESLWCDYELNEAFHLSIKKAISRTMVFIIQDSIGLDKIPDWLKRALIRTEFSPAIIAREIHHHIIKSTEKYQYPLFLGRSKEREMVEDVINPFDGRRKPKTFAVFGLPGIGRRSIVASCVVELFSLSRVIEIEIESGDNANSLSIKIADKAEAYSCQEELRDIIKNIEAMSEMEALEITLKNMEKLVLGGELPVIIDVGGCLNDNGTFKTYINNLIRESERYKSLYFVFVLARRVNKENNPHIECIPIEQLPKKSIGQLLSKLADVYDFKIDKTQIEELSDYIDGYPPSAYYAAKQSSMYGVPALISDKGKLVQFSKRKFVTHIKDQNLSSGDASVLRILSLYSPLPLDALLALYEDELDTSNAHDKIYELIDCSLVRVTEGQNYRISDPIKGSVRDVLGSSSRLEVKKVMNPLQKHVEKASEENKLEFARVLFRMDFVTGDNKNEKIGIRLRGDYIKLLEQAYHQQQYKEAVKLGREAVKECPEDSSARNFLIKALIQEELWDEAESYINDLYPVDEYRNVYYLRGFLERKRGRIPEAIKAYDMAESYGRKGVSLYRELAHCNIMIDEYDSAKKHINSALRIQPDNSHILDMAAKLEIKNGNKNEAKQYIDKLELLDDPKHFHMRASSFYAKFGQKDEALFNAKKATQIGGKRFFSGRVQYVKALILNLKYTLAKEEIRKIENDFSGQKIDVRVALECSLAAAEGDNNTGLKIVEKFTNSSTKQAKAYKKKFLQALSVDITVPYQQRKQYMNQLDLLKSVNDIDLFDIEI